MKEQNQTGDGPAPRFAPTGRADTDIIEDDAVPATQTLRAELAACPALIAECAGIAGDSDHPPAARSHAAQSAARLATASAQAASAIARIVDAETRQRLATLQIDAALYRPRFRNTARRPPHEGAHDSYRASDWETPPSETEKSHFNSGPRVRHP
jgi:hypothetical protein